MQSGNTKMKLKLKEAISLIDGFNNDHNNNN